MIKFILSSLFFLVIQLGHSQEQNGVDKIPQISDTLSSDQGDRVQVYNLTGIEFKPEFTGGIAAFYKYIAKKFRAPSAKEFKGGKIFASFIIEKDCSVTSIKVNRDPGFGTAEETKRVLKACPRWKPGEQNGKQVRVLYSIPITLQSN